MGTMCKYCKGNENDYSDEILKFSTRVLCRGLYGEIDICHNWQTNELEATYLDSDANDYLLLEHVKINYCPMCGRKLEGEAT